MGSVHQGHRARQRKKLLENGPRAFADHELLEMLLYYAIPRRDTNELAHRLLERFGSLQGVFSAPVEELSTVEGVGENAAVLLSLVPQIWQRSLQGAPERILNSVDKCGEYFAELLSGSRREGAPGRKGQGAFLPMPGRGGCEHGGGERAAGGGVCPAGRGGGRCAGP